MYQPDASIVICTHNPRKEYLDRVVSSLQAQSVPSEQWELILVDNGSKSPVARDWDLSWHPHARHIFEPRLGLASARHRGISEAASQLLIFVDDDNVLAPDYIAQALRIEREWRFLGAWGSGWIDAEFEVDPAQHLSPLLPWLAVRHVDHPVWSNVKSCTDATPFGAGLCIRRKIGEAYVEHCDKSTIAITGRKGSSLGAHEDFEICYLACEAGFGMGIFPELKITHLIAKERVTDNHFVRLVEGVTLSKLVLANKWSGEVPRSPISLRGMASLGLNLLTRRGFDRRIYFAELRAVIGARRLLKKLGPLQPSTPNERHRGKAAASIAAGEGKLQG
jgi:glycosyltransferase involved in cell wall biosynthesis